MNIKYKVLSPIAFSGSPYGDFGYEIDGVKSSKGYSSERGARVAMERVLEKMGFYKSNGDV